MELETRRQLLHLSGSLTPLYLWALKEFAGSELAPAYLLLTMLAAGYAISHLYRKGWRSPFFSRMIDMAERESSMATPGRGALRFYTGVLLAYLLLLWLGEPYYTFTTVVLVLAVGDSLCVLVGMRVGGKKLPYNRSKSLEGTLAGFGSAFALSSAVLLAIFGLTASEAVPIAFAAAFTGILVETLPLPVDDNISIPLACALALALLF